MAYRETAYKPKLERNRNLFKVISQQKIAFVFGRPVLNAAKLQYMPFALSTIKTVAEEHGGPIDVYLTQKNTSDYTSLLPKHVNLIFLENKFVWSKGSGTKLYLLLTLYFRILTRGKKYTKVYGIGQTGVVLGGQLAKRNSAKFICLNDEFPNISYLKIWRENEKKYTAMADIVILPDESRIAVLKTQVNFSSHTQFFVLPNIPLKKNIQSLPDINWRKKLELDSNARLIVYAGGIDRENNIDFILTVFPFTEPDFFLVLVGNGQKYKNDNYLSFKRIIWIEEPLTDDELHSLVSQAVCSLGYYADFLDLEYVGKSSGKIMRSLLLGTPVISTKFESLRFIEDSGMGELISKPFELIEAIRKIELDRKTYVAGIKANIEQYTFEYYWKKIKDHL